MTARPDPKPANGVPEPTAAALVTLGGMGRLALSRPAGRVEPMPIATLAGRSAHYSVVCGAHRASVGALFLRDTAVSPRNLRQIPSLWEHGPAIHDAERTGMLVASRPSFNFLIAARAARFQFARSIVERVRF